MRCVSTQQLSFTQMVREVSDINGLYNLCLSEGFVRLFERWVLVLNMKVITQGREFYLTFKYIVMPFVIHETRTI